MAPRRLGIELAPDRVAVWMRGEGLVLDEPAVLARQVEGGRPLALGAAALELASEHSPGVELTWPLGVRELADQEAAGHLLRQVVVRVVGRVLFSRHELMLALPADLSTAGRRQLLEAAMASGARMAHVIDVPLAACLGAGLPVAAWTPLALLFLVPQAAQVAAVAHDGLLSHDFRTPPRGTIAGLAQAWDSEAGLETLAGLVEELLDQLPPELRSGAREQGLTVAGRSLGLTELGERLGRRTGIRTRVPPDPQNCVAKGAHLALERIGALGSQGLLYLR